MNKTKMTKLLKPSDRKKYSITWASSGSGKSVYPRYMIEKLKQQSRIEGK